MFPAFFMLNESLIIRNAMIKLVIETLHIIERIYLNGKTEIIVHFRGGL